jgi:hypothetical protein
LEEDATFCLIKDGTFFPLFCLTNPAQVEDTQSILDCKKSSKTRALKKKIDKNFEPTLSRLGQRMSKKYLNINNQKVKLFFL